MSVITIVGSGMMGSAMSFPARANGHEVRLVGTHLDREIISQAEQTGWHITLKRWLPAGIKYYQIERLEEALSGADLLIGGVSSMGVDWFSQQVIPKVPASLPILSVTKGMIHTEKGEFISYPEFYARQHAQSGIQFCAIGGPCTSYELADLDQTQVCFCGPDMALLRRLKALLNTDYYHVSLSTDIRGVECAVALKNAYALGVTLAVGLSEKLDGKMHYNSQAALFGQSVREMRKILALFGGQDVNIYLGAGDLYVTVFGGRTRMIGTLLGKGYQIDEAKKELAGVTLESLVIAGRTADAVRGAIRDGRADEEDYPLLMYIDRLLKGESGKGIPWDKFETEMGE